MLPAEEGRTGSKWAIVRDRYATDVGNPVDAGPSPNLYRGISLALGNRDDGVVNPTSNTSLILFIDNVGLIQWAKFGIHIIGRQKIAHDCHYRARKGAWRACAVLEFPEMETVPLYVVTMYAGKSTLQLEKGCSVHRGFGWTSWLSNVSIWSSISSASHVA